MHTLARFTIFLCFAWVGLWVLWGATATGYAWFLNEMAASFSAENAKLAMPVLVLALPIILAGSVASLCWIREPSSRRGPNYGVQLESKSDKSFGALKQGPMSQTYHAKLPHSCPSWIHQLFQCCCRSRIFRCCEEMDERIVFILFCLFPVGVYVSNHINRHLNKLQMDVSGKYDDSVEYFDKKVMEEANGFGFAAFICLNLLLILVARHSPLLSVMNWSRPHALIFHRWIGIMTVVSVFLHGSMHIYRWVMVENLSLWYMVTIPTQCWKDWEGYNPECDDCECPNHMKNMFGFLALLVFLIMLVFALEPVRRRCYWLFYNIHVLAAPLALICTVMHYEKAIFYLAGGILYYLASSMPVFVETQTSNHGNAPPLVSAELIESESMDNDKIASGERSCVSLTIEVTETALERYRAGQYVRLWVPQISTRDVHPFTISPVLSSDREGCTHMRIIFRQTGNFTKQLGNLLIDSPCDFPPKIFMEGFHGSQNRMDQLLKHDSVLILAGGIGITPYLSLLEEVAERNAASATTKDKSKAVHLHWVCRDRGLIDYVRREHLNHIIRAVTAEYDIQCTIHYTGWSTDFGLDAGSDNDGGFSSAVHSQRRRRRQFDSSSNETAVPFQPSKFAVGSKYTYQGNLPMFLSFLLTGGLGLVMIWFLKTDWILIIPVIVLSVLVSLLINKILPDHGELFLSLSSLDDEDAVAVASSELELSIKGRVGHDETESSSTTLEGGSNSSSPSLSFTSSMPPSDSGIPPPTPFVQVKDGRPFLPDLFSEASLDSGSNPAVFVCGPKSLIKSVREKVRYCGSCSLTGSFGCCSGRNVAVYEEAFEL